jgi:hypothetical protein
MQSLGWRGADAVVDAGDFVAFAIGFLVDEVISAFGLSDGAIAWTAGEEQREKAAALLQTWRTRQTCD